MSPKILHEYVPTIRSFGGVGSKTGFVAAPSSYNGNNHRADYEFNNYYAPAYQDKDV